MKKFNLTVKHQSLVIKRGFTLIELLVVMLIIGLLAGLSLFAMGGARESARDGRRKADLEAFRSALEIYKADCDYYPDSFPAPDDSLDGGDSPCTVGASNVYIKAVSDDPLSGRDYTYQPSGCTSGTDCTQYLFWSALEDPGSLPAFCTGAPACDSVTCNYCVSNP